RECTNATRGSSAATSCWAADPGTYDSDHRLTSFEPSVDDHRNLHWNDRGDNCSDLSASPARSTCHRCDVTIHSRKKYYSGGCNGPPLQAVSPNEQPSRDECQHTVQN